ncbi:MAG TPA: hypothetical protein VFF27_08710 [Bacteroidia bacterium]|jgi:hypothetical protein|nr:hypothetical protein [Bacteroidia bacterium]
MKTIQTKVAVISYNAIERIVIMRILDGAEIELENAHQNQEAVKQLTNNEKHLLIVDARSVDVYVSKEARAYSAEFKQNDPCIAKAFIINSTANRLIGNFYINFNKPKVPTKLFSNEEKAVEWLKSFLYLTELEDIPTKKRAKK